ncbi:hypothetical protein CHU98_g2402 [Xylaria longipes]|nr:hypothetical protein CHU98_g2402 [Xylaria longipes]
MRRYEPLKYDQTTSGTPCYIKTHATVTVSNAAGEGQDHWACLQWAFTAFVAALLATPRGAYFSMLMAFYHILILIVITIYQHRVLLGLGATDKPYYYTIKLRRFGLVSTEVVVAAAATELLRQSHCCGTAAAVPPQPQSSASLRMLDHLMAILKCFDVDAEVNYDKLVEKLNLSRRSAHSKATSYMLYQQNILRHVLPQYSPSTMLSTTPLQHSIHHI